MISEPSFFRTVLGATAKREVKVSSAFAACFAASSAFRKTMLNVLWHVCAIGGRRPQPDSWRCRTEVAVSDGRFDLELTSTDSIAPVFRLENKVEDPLTAGQLSKYRSRHGRVRLVAVTKHAPDVGQQWLHEHSCYSMRWQEVHRALATAIDVRGSDAFLCRAFRDYLEELGMAHREDIGRNDFQELQRFFRTVTADRRYAGMDARDALDVGGSCLDLLQDVARAAVEREPRPAKWVRWGPAYFNWKNDDASRDHHLAFRFMKKGWKHWIGAGFVVPEAPVVKAYWIVWGKTSVSREFEQRSPLRDVCSRGSLDQSKLVKHMFSSIARRGVWQ